MVRLPGVPGMVRLPGVHASLYTLPGTTCLPIHPPWYHMPALPLYARVKWPLYRSMHGLNGRFYYSRVDNGRFYYSRVDNVRFIDSGVVNGRFIDSGVVNGRFYCHSPVNAAFTVTARLMPALTSPDQ